MRHDDEISLVSYQNNGRFFVVGSHLEKVAGEWQHRVGDAASFDISRDGLLVVQFSAAAWRAMDDPADTIPFPETISEEQRRAAVELRELLNAHIQK